MATLREQRRNRPSDKLHDVGFVNGVDFLALVLAGVFKGKTRNAGRSFFSDNLQALHHSGDDFVLQSGVKALGILAHDDQVNVGIARRNVRQIAHRTEVRIQIELLSQLHVDAGKAAAHWRCDRTLQSDMSALDGLRKFLRDVFLVFLKSLGARLNGFPFKFESCGFKNADYCLSNLCADTVTGDKCNFVGHED